MMTANIIVDFPVDKTAEAEIFANDLRNGSLDVIRASVQAKPSLALTRLRKPPAMHGSGRTIWHGQGLAIHIACRYSEDDIILFLAESFPQCLQVRTYAGHLPIQIYVRDNPRPSVRVLKTLLEAFPASLAGLLHIGASSHAAPTEIIEYLIRADPTGLIRKGMDGTLPLHKACSNTRGHSISLHSREIAANPNFVVQPRGSETTRPGAYAVTRTATGPAQVYRATVPAGVIPGGDFIVLAGTRRFRVRCPNTARPGQPVQIRLPPDPVIHQTSLKMSQLTATTGSGGGRAIPVTQEGMNVNKAGTYSTGKSTLEVFIKACPQALMVVDTNGFLPWHRSLALLFPGIDDCLTKHYCIEELGILLAANPFSVFVPPRGWKFSSGKRWEFSKAVKFSREAGYSDYRTPMNNGNMLCTGEPLSRLCDRWRTIVIDKHNPAIRMALEKVASQLRLPFDIVQDHIWRYLIPQAH